MQHLKSQSVAVADSLKLELTVRVIRGVQLIPPGLDIYWIRLIEAGRL